MHRCSQQPEISTRRFGDSCYRCQIPSRSLSCRRTVTARRGKSFLNASDRILPIRSSIPEDKLYQTPTRLQQSDRPAEAICQENWEVPE